MTDNLKGKSLNGIPFASSLGVDDKSVNDFNFDKKHAPSSINDFNFPELDYLPLGKIDFVSGENYSLDDVIVVGASVELESFYYDGSSMSASLLPSAIFNINCYDGHYVNSTVTYFPITPLSRIDIYNGSSYSFELSAQTNHEVSFIDGSTLDIGIKFFPVVDLGQITIEDGSLISNFDIEFLQSQILTLLPIPSGENFDSRLSTNAQLKFNIESGENHETKLSVEESLSTSARDGALFNFDIEIFPTKGLEFEYTVGEYSELTLNTGTVVMRPLMYSGESISPFNIDFTPPVILSNINAYHGSVLSQSVINSTFIGIKTNASDGSELSLDLIIDNGELHHYGVGENYESTLSTFDAISVKPYYDGSTLDNDITFVPPVSMQFNAYHGYNFQIPIDHLYSPSLVFYPMMCDSWFDMSIEPATTHFELCNSCDYPVISDTVHFLQERYEDIRMSYSAEIGTRFSIELTRDITLSSNAYAGESLEHRLAEPLILGTFNAYHGYSSADQITIIEDKGFDVDLSNPIIDGDNANVELGTDDPTPEKYHVYRDGAIGWTDLSINYRLNIVTYDGAEMITTLTVEQPWEVKFGFGAHLDFELSTTVRITADYYDGTNTKAVFYEPSNNSYGGEEMVATLKIEYEVDFDEVGCLDNEHKYYKEDGVTVDELKTTVASIELLPFTHSLKARCY